MTQGTLPESDPALESLDHETLVSRLQQANDRLRFYEAFDEMISANVRQSEALMREAIASREASLREAVLTARGPVVSMLETLDADVRDLRDRVDQALATIATVRATLGSDATVHAESGSDQATSAVNDQDLATRSTGQRGEIDHSPRAITVVAHGVAATSQALSLQRHVAGLAGVERVDTREFAEGVLRLQVSATRGLDHADFSSWENGKLTVRNLETGLVELTLMR